MMSKLNATTFGGIGLGPNSDGQFQIGGTYATAGDVSNAAAGDGVTLTAAKPFAFSVYADDGGTAIASSWASAGFFSYINFAAQAAGSAMALTGQMHIGANFTAGDNIAGVYGITECDSAKTINAHVFGGQFGVSLSAGTVGASYRVAAIQVGVNTNGATISGTKTGINFINAAAGGMSAAMSFGTIAGDMTGCGADLVADVSETPLGHILVYLGPTLGYINVYSDAT
jgi:hypothetical protein